MFEVNGIAYASEKSNKISITDAKVTDHLMMIQILKLCMASLHG